MPVELISEDDLRVVLRPHRVDPQAFEAGVRQRLIVGAKRLEADPLDGVSPWLRTAAALLPLPIAAGKVGAAGGSKLLGYLAFPAISLFILLGATVLSWNKIRDINRRGATEPIANEALPEAVKQWWRYHKWGARFVFATTLLLAFVGATWILYLLYVISLGLLVYVLAGLSKAGIGNQQVIGPSCLMALMLLGQVALFSGIGNAEIHFIDQAVVAVVFFGGVAILTPLVGMIELPKHSPLALFQRNPVGRWVAKAIYGTLLTGLSVWILNPIIWPTTPARIKDYVESFDHAPFYTASWQQWEIPARWTIDRGLDPNLARPRRRFEQELRGQQNFFILDNAFRVGLIHDSDLKRLKDYTIKRRILLQDPGNPLLRSRPLISLESEDWVIRAAVKSGDLTDAERDYLVSRLHATIENLLDEKTDALQSALRATQLLSVIDRPVPAKRYRDEIHSLLRKYHCLDTGGFQLAGGFKQYDQSWTSSLESTAYAVELMEIYGVPEDLDPNWVRSYLKPIALSAGNRKWMAAVTRDRLERLPGISPPGWLEIIYYERSMLAAAVLVGLCIYATVTSPRSVSNSSEPQPAHAS